MKHLRPITFLCLTLLAMHSNAQWQDQGGTIVTKDNVRINSPHGDGLLRIHDTENNNMLLIGTDEQDKSFIRLRPSLGVGLAITNNGDDEAIFVTALEGNVGIGTKAPIYPFHVAKNAYFAQDIFGDGVMSFRNSADNVALLKLDYDKFSLALGYGANANANYSTAFGKYAKANGNISTAMGYNTQANGYTSTAMGYESKANGSYALASGRGTEAAGNYATTMGYFTAANSQSSLAIGRFNIGNGNLTNWVETDPLFEIGNGTSVNNRSNALTIYKNGNALLNGDLELSTTHVMQFNHGNFEKTQFFPDTNHKLRLKAKDGWGPGYWDVLTIDASNDKNYLGIATSNPSANLHVKGSVRLEQLSGQGDYLAIDANGYVTRTNLQGGGGNWQQAGNNLYYTNGNVGIGTSNPYQKLMVNGNAQINGELILDNDLGGNLHFSNGLNRVYVKSLDEHKLSFQGKDGWGPGTWDVLTIDFDNGSEAVGINRVNPYYELDVNGIVRANTFTYNSDKRFKKNIKDLGGSLEKINALSGVSYQFNQNQHPDAKFSSREQIGFIAQDVQKVLPELVYEDGEGYLSVDYISVIPVLVEAIKEQQKLIEAQNSKLDALQTSSNLKVGQEELVLPQKLTLKQNKPNPFNEQTEISFYVPEHIKDATLYIYNMNGEQLEKLSIEQRGAGSISISAGQLNAGIYLYTLIADGQEVGVKKMILTR